MRLSFLRLLICVVTLLCYSACLAESQPPSSFYLFTVENEPRLNKKISILSPSISLNDALAEISKQTGVSITTEQDDPISGATLTISLSKQPAIEAINGVLSLISYKGARAYVQPTLKAGKKTYLIRLKECHNAQAALTRIGNLAFKRQYELYLMIAELEPAERKKYQIEFEKSMYLTEGVKLDVWFALNEPSIERAWEQIRLFSKLTTETDREKVFAGIPFSLSAKDFKPGMMDQIRDVLSVPKTSVSNNISSPTEIRDVFFTFNQKAGVRKLLMPCLYFGSTSAVVGSDPSDYVSKGAFSIVGLANGNLAPIIQKDWILEGDKASSKLVEQNIAPDAKPLKEFQETPPMTLFSSKCFGSNKIQYIGLFPIQKNMGGFYPATSVRGALKDLIAPTRVVMSKWRNDLLLLNYADWFYGDDSVPSAAQVAWLRKRVDSHGFLSLQDLSIVIDLLSAPQVKAMLEEFPVLAVQDDMRAFLKLYLLRPEVASATGIALDENIAPLLEISRERMKLFPAPGRSIRIRTSRDFNHESKREAFNLIVETKQGNADWMQAGRIPQFELKFPTKAQIDRAREQAMRENRL